MNDGREDQFDGYLENELSAEERLEFEGELLRDSELRAALDKHKEKVNAEIRAIDSVIEHELRRQTEDWDFSYKGNLREEDVLMEEEQVLQNSPTTSKRLRFGDRKFNSRLFAAAASVLLLFIAGYFILVNTKPTTPKKIAERFYEQPEPPGNQLGSNTAIWISAKGEFKDGNFEVFINKLSILEGRTEEMNYYLAHAYYQIGDHVESSKLFALIADGNSLYNRRAEWHFVLSELGKGDVDSELLIKLDRIINNPNHPYFDEAKELKSLVDK